MTIAVPPWLGDHNLGIWQPATFRLQGYCNSHQPAISCPALAFQAPAALCSVTLADLRHHLLASVDDRPGLAVGLHGTGFVRQKNEVVVVVGKHQAV